MRRLIRSSVECLLLALVLMVWVRAPSEASLSPSLTDAAASRWFAPRELAAESIGKAVFDGDTAQVEARLLISKGADPRVGVLFDLAPGWHLYWRNPGGTGIAPTLGLEGDGLHVGDLDWPAPRVFEEADGLFITYGYENQVLLSSRLRESDLSPESESGNHTIRARPEILVCRTECVPAAFDLRSEFAPKLDAESQRSIDQLFAATQTLLPVSNAVLGAHAEAGWLDDSPSLDESAQLAFVFSTCAHEARDCGTAIHESQGAPFLPFEDQPFEFEQMRVVPASGPAGQIRVEMVATRLESGDDRIRGLVPLRDPEGRLRHVEIDLAIAAAQPAQLGGVAPAVAAPGVGRWLEVLLLALVGGLILNGMPCVLPVLAIKVVAIADLAEKDAKGVRLQGLAYTAGVLGSMLFLGAGVVSLRAAGHSVGWGFQFQEPLFVAAISAVLVTFALNLFGVFEIDFGQGRLAGIGQQGSVTRRSLFEGLLAVVLATPCTAPFLGTAVGFAFAAPGIGILAIFLAIGLGLASPFLVVSFIPGFARFIPRSGPWMLKLRAGLGFCLLGTIVWLLWIMGQSGGTDAVIGMIAILLLLSFLLWGFGQAQPLESAWIARAGALMIAGIAFAGFNLIGFEASPSAPPRSISTAHDEMEWAPYSEAAVARALAKGRPAFVVFTADWCITCQVNEKRVIERPATRNAFAENDVALFKADWTRRDEAIRAKLAEFGRAGVPLYLVYSADDPNNPRVLSELLSHKEVQAALAAVGGPAQG